MTDPTPEPVPEGNRFELIFEASAVVTEATPDEGERP